MKVWMVMAIVLWVGGAHAQDTASFQVSAAPTAESPVFAGLDSAIASAANFASATLTLLPGAFTVSTSTTVLSRLHIRGEGQVITFQQSLTVSGSLSISNSIVSSKIKNMSMISVVGGSVLIDGSSVDGSISTLATGTGSVILEDSTFSNNNAPIIVILAAEANVKVLRCVIINHNGEFLQVLLKGNIHGYTTVSIDRTIFRENRGAGYLINYSVPFLTGSITVSNTEFTLNSIPQLYLDIGKNQVEILGCTFQDNSQSSLTIYANGAMLTIRDTLWARNSEILLVINQLIGDLLMSGITITSQKSKGMIQISNSILISDCRFTLQDSSFLDTYFIASEPSPGAINAVGCTMIITRTLFKDVIMNAIDQSDVESLIIVKVGSLSISNLTLINSGSVGFGIAVIAGHLEMIDTLLNNLLAGIRIYVVSTSGELTMQNVRFMQPVEFPTSEIKMGGKMSLYIGCNQSQLKLRNVQVEPGLLTYDSDSIINAVFSNIDISGVLVRDVYIEIVAILVMVTGSISDITIHRSRLGSSVFHVFNEEIIQISNLFVDDAFVDFDFNCIFSPSRMMYVNCSDFAFHNATIGCLVTSRFGEVHMRNVSITDSRFQYFVYNQIASDITIEGLEVRDSIGGLALFFHSSLYITDSYLQQLSSRTHMVVGESVNITFERVVFKTFTSPLSLCQLYDDSQLFIKQSSFSNYQSLSDKGFLIDSGALSVINSNFSSFNVMLFQIYKCKVSIRNSLFRDVRNNVQSEKSDFSYGGVLACVDCSAVNVESSSFLNISAMHGGALAVRTSTAPEPPVVHIGKCEFIVCSAVAGGAVYLQGSSFRIDDSWFLGNSANLTGGAVDAYTLSGLPASIRNCVFQRNYAKEGGGVKWRKSPISFSNVTFQDNSAEYGSEIASFGVRVVGNRSSLNETEGSGYPLTLLFELHDHYDHRVTTASTEYLQLVNDSQINYRGNQAVTINKGVFNFSELTVYAQPNSRQTIPGVMSYQEGNRMYYLNGSIDIDFRDCVIGEVRKADRCEYCFSGNVSLNPSDPECSFCPMHALCLGGDKLVVDHHYWRESTHTTKLIKCPLRETCLGGEGSTCADGYTGKVCNECAEDWTRIRSMECEFCGNHIIQWVKMSGMVVPIAALYIAVRGSSDVQLFILKQIINHAQMLSTLNYLRVSYPAAIVYWFHGLSYFSSLFITELPISCFEENQPERIRVIVASALPSIVLLLLILLSRGQRKEKVIQCTSALMFVPMISLYAHMPLLACQAVASEAQWQFFDMSQQCWQGSHLFLIKTVVVPSVLLNVLLPIALVSAVSVASPTKFDELFPLWRTGVMWRSWDLFPYGTKAVLICILGISVVIDEISQVAYGLTVLIFVSVIAVSLNSFAYIHWKLFFLMEYSLVIVAVSMGLCSYFIYHSPTEGATGWLITSVFLLLNVGYFAVCAKMWIFPATQTEKKAEEDCSGSVPPPNSMIEVLECSQEHS